MTTPQILLYIEDPSREDEGRALSEKWHLPLTIDPHSPYLLALTTRCLELRLPDRAIKPIFIDFLNGPLRHRLNKVQGRSELIARAVGIKGNYRPSVIDATAGFGTDAAILATLGCSVEMIERSPIVFLLLDDALKRARLHNPDFLPHLRLHFGDAKFFLRKKMKEEGVVEVIYLDPMFPERVKTANVKKGMRTLQQIVGINSDVEELFSVAKQCANKRVVVKRPRYAKTITPESPSVVYTMKSCRFDVYTL